MAVNKQQSRRSFRLPEFDYSQPGEYFIIIVTHHRERLFGEIIDEKMRLNHIGQIALRCWMEIPLHFKNTELGEFTIMPNHGHGIIHIIDEPCRGIWETSDWINSHHHSNL